MITTEKIVTSSMDEFVARDGVVTSAMMGSRGLKVNGKFFAMYYKEKLVVKLTKERVDKFVADGVGSQFDPGHGRKMKEWVELVPKTKKECCEYLEEAIGIVSAIANAGKKAIRGLTTTARQ